MQLKMALTSCYQVIPHQIFLAVVKETGEVEAGVMRRIMRTRFRSSMKDAVIAGNLITRNYQLRAFSSSANVQTRPKPSREKRHHQIERFPCFDCHPYAARMQTLKGKCMAEF